jgi:hypothetical protein
MADSAESGPHDWNGFIDTMRGAARHGSIARVSTVAIIVLSLALLGVSAMDIVRGVLKLLCAMAAFGLFFWLLSGLERNQGLAVILGIGIPIVIGSIWFTLAWNRRHPHDRIDWWNGQSVDRFPG